MQLKVANGISSLYSANAEVSNCKKSISCKDKEGRKDGKSSIRFVFRANSLLLIHPHLVTDVTEGNGSGDRGKRRQ